MADEADRALRDAEVLDEAHIRLIREQAAMIPKGVRVIVITAENTSNDW